MFGLTPQTLAAMFIKYRKRAGLEGFTFHDARHSAATRIAQRLHVLDLCLVFGWKNPKMAMTYYQPKASDLAKRLNIPIQIHLAETSAEIGQSQDRHKLRPVALLDSLKFWAPITIGAHGVWVNASEIALLTARNVGISNNPESNMKLASGTAPVVGYRQAGVNVGLGTDGAASNNDLDLLGETRTAALLAKAVAGSATALDAHRALRMTTLNGARALGLDEQIGSLELGKAADIAVFNLSGLAQQPVYDPVSQLIYAGGRACVEHLWVGGKQLLDGGQLTRLDEQRIIANARAWGAKIAGK